MKTTAIVSAALAASMGFGSIAQADTGRHQRGQDNDQQGWQQQQQRDQRWDGQRQGHWQGQPQAQPQQRQYQHAYPQQQYRNDGQFSQRAVPQQYYGAQRYDGGRGYYGQYNAPRYVRGGYLPRHYMAQNYWVNDWHARRLAPPPYGYQWVESDAGELILVALATGLIANVLFNY